MTLQEALASGRAFRRPGKHWKYLWNRVRTLEETITDDCRIFTPADVMATDWEVYEERLALTWSYILEAHGIAREASQGDNPRYFAVLKKELGFTE